VLEENESFDRPAVHAALVDHRTYGTSGPLVPAWVDYTAGDELLGGIEHGLVLDGARNGQADANGEFMFGTREAYPIKNGKLGELQRGVNISGRAFDVLKTVDRVGSEFRWDLGSGYCGKGQPAKVDAGGPWLCCEVLVGGRHA
jgi:TldD protein